jgi:hypothetical protein
MEKVVPMTESKEITIITEAISQISTADNQDIVENYISDALVKLQACGATEDDARFMLKSAIVSREDENDNPNFFRAFTILEKPVPPPTQAIIQGLWTYRVERPIEQCVSALNELAQYVRTNAGIFVTTGPKMLTPQETSARKQKIEELANQIKTLAIKVPDGTVNYEAVEAILKKLRELGFFPDNLLVSNLARAFERAGLLV